MAIKILYSQDKCEMCGFDFWTTGIKDVDSGKTLNICQKCIKEKLLEPLKKIEAQFTLNG